MKSNQKKPRVTDEEFVRVWQTAETRDEVCALLGTTRAAISMRATNLRRVGVPLKKFSRTTCHDIPKLTELAKSLNGEVA